MAPREVLWAMIEDGLAARPAPAGVLDAFVDVAAQVEGMEGWDRLGPTVGLAARLAVTLNAATWTRDHDGWPPPPVQSPLPAMLCRTTVRLTAQVGPAIDLAQPANVAPELAGRLLAGVLRGTDTLHPTEVERFEARRSRVADADHACRAWLEADDDGADDRRLWAALDAAPPTDPLAAVDLNDRPLAQALRGTVRRVLDAFDGDTGLGVLDVSLACWWVAGGRRRLDVIVADPAAVRLDLVAALHRSLAFAEAQPAFAPGDP